MLFGLDLKGKSVLEPSAGSGNIAIACRDKGAIVYCVEYMQEMREILIGLNFPIVIEDFMKMPVGDYFDFVIANPPFTKQQDIKHIRKMYNHLKTGGILRSIASTKWIEGSEKGSLLFRQWLKSVGGIYEILDSNSFKDAGTNIDTCLISIIK